MQKVYVSSTYQDLVEYRLAVLSQLKKLGMVDVAMEHYSADERGPLERCLEDVRACDLHVTILAWRYGFVPEGQEKSITELEYREAGDHGIDRLVFLLDQDTPWLRRWMDETTGEGDQGRRITEFRNELAQTQLVSFFRTKEQLAGELAAAVASWKERHAAGVVTPRDALRDYLDSQVALDAAIESRYVELEATTQVVGGAALDWPEALLPPAIRDAITTTVEPSTQVQELGDVEAGLSLHPRFVLLGDAGSGKTTTLRRLRLSAARAALAEPRAPIPLMIRLPEWPASITDFASLLVHEREVQGLPLITPSRHLLLLDGLNEVDSDSYDARVQLLEAWLRLNSVAKVVVASRARHYQQHRQLSLPTVRIHPLDEARIRAFASKFLGPVGGPELVARLGEELLHVARNPFLLSLLCYVYQRHGGQLPRTRGELLRAALHSLYLRELERGNARGLSYETFQDALGVLALGIVHGRAATSVSLEWSVKRLPKGVDAERLVRLATDAGVITLSKNDRFLQFSHQIFLEHMAAEYLASHPERLAAALPAPGFADGDRVQRPFDEVAYGLVTLGDRNASLSEIAEREPFLAADALKYLEPNTVRSEVTDQIVQRLLQQLGQADADARTAAVARLVRLGDAAVPGLREIMTHAGPRVRRAAVSILARIGSLDALEGVALALLDGNRWVRKDARQLLSNLDDEERSMMDRYFSERLPAYPAGQRKEVAKALASSWRADDAELLGRLAEVAGLEMEELAPSTEDSSRAPSSGGLEAGEASERRAVEEAWATKLKEDPGDAKLARLQQGSLESKSPDSPAWGSAWRKLWRSRPNDPALATRGLRWLEEVAVDHPSWLVVWRVLSVAEEDATEVAQAAARWLRAMPLDHRSLGEVWADLAEHGRLPADLQALGGRWVRSAALDAPHWGHAFRVASANEALERPTESALFRALDTFPDGSDDWSSVLESLCDSGVAWVALENVVRRFLTGFPSHRSWPFIWEQLVKEVGPGPELVEEGRLWLRQHSLMAPGWALVWKEIVAALPEDGEALEQGWKWMGPRFAGRVSWPVVWKVLWERTTEQGGLSRIGRDWLTSYLPVRTGARGVWLSLWSYAQDDDLLRRWASAFLQAAPDHPASPTIEATLAEAGGHHPEPNLRARRPAAFS